MAFVAFVVAVIFCEFDIVASYGKTSDVTSSESVTKYVSGGAAAGGIFALSFGICICCYCLRCCIDARNRNKRKRRTHRPKTQTVQVNDNAPRQPTRTIQTPEHKNVQRIYSCSALNAHQQRNMTCVLSNTPLWSGNQTTNLNNATSLSSSTFARQQPLLSTKAEAPICVLLNGNVYCGALNGHITDKEQKTKIPITILKQLGPE